MKHLYPVLMFLLCPLLVSAQDFNGTFSAQLPEGRAELNLTQADGNMLSGRMVDTDGSQYTIEGVVEQGVASGAFYNELFGALFEAELTDDRITFYVIPIDLFGNPLPDQATPYELTRDGATDPPDTDAKTETRSTSQSPSPPKSAPTSSDPPRGTGDIQKRQIHDKYLGLGFDLPTGWKHQETDGVFLLGHDTTPGFIAIELHDYKALNQLKSAAYEGFTDEQGTNLQISGDIKAYGDDGIQAEFKGTIQSKPAKGYAVGLMSQFGGGVTIMCGVAADQYSADDKERVLAIAKSMVFEKLVIPPIAEQWQRDLTNCRLTYMSSYSSSDYNGGYSGSSTEINIDLCDGYFTRDGYSSMSIDAGSGYNSGAYQSSNNQGAGEWKVVARGKEPVLKLLYHDGTSSEYNITTEDGKTFLNGDRYFRICAGEGLPDQRPQCR